MSDTATPGAAPEKPGPEIAVYKRDDGSLVAHVHVIDRLRTVFGTSMDDIRRRVHSTLISEFGLSQPAAEAVVADHGLVPAPSVADYEAEKAAADEAHAAAMKLEDELSAAQGERDTAVGERDAARKETEAAEGERDAALAERDALQAKVTDLEDQLSVATQPLPMATGNAEAKPEEEKPAEASASVEKPAKPSKEA